eukprot:365547-Chlamydomonas_euryale.AAC.3
MRMAAHVWRCPDTRMAAHVWHVTQVFTVPWTNVIMGGGLRLGRESLIEALKGSVERTGGPLDLWSIHFPFPGLKQEVLMETLAQAVDMGMTKVRRRSCWLADCVYERAGICCLAGCLAGWLCEGAGWLVGWQAGCGHWLAGWLAACMGWLGGWLADCVHGLTGWLVHGLANLLAGRLSVCIVWLACWLAVCVHGLAD